MSHSCSDLLLLGLTESVKSHRVVFEWADSPTVAFLEPQNGLRCGLRYSFQPIQIVDALCFDDPVDPHEKQRQVFASMRNWTTKEVAQLLQWTRLESEDRQSLEEMARALGRSPSAVKIFLRRLLPAGERPWREKPRWEAFEVTTLHQGAQELPRRLTAAIKKYAQRHGIGCSIPEEGEDQERVTLTASQLAADLGLSRAEYTV